MSSVTVVKVKDKVGYEAAVAIRTEVFVREQHVPAELEIDAYENESIFFLAQYDQKPAATGRFRVKENVYLKFERIATRASYRRKGIGRLLMERMSEEGFKSFPSLLQIMHSQLDAVPFYQELGWQKIGTSFFEAGIEHFVMINPPSSSSQRNSLLCLKETSTPPMIRAALAQNETDS